MKNNENKTSLLLMNYDKLLQLHDFYCGAKEIEICERHDLRIGELEESFRNLLGWEEDDEEIEVAWQQLDLAIQDMYREMITAAFVAGIQYGAGFVKGCGDGTGNGRLVEAPVTQIQVGL